MPQGWSIDSVADTITFLEPLGSADSFTVNEYPTAAINATSIFRMGAWCPAYGYPREVEFFADRLAWGSTAAQPQTLWFSRIGDYSMFGRSTPIADDDPITITLNARQLNAIVDFMPKQHLLVLTTGGVWKVGDGEDTPLTPATVAARPQPSVGIDARFQSLDVGETAIYYTHKGGQVRDISYAFEADGYAGSDLTAFASHLLKGRRLQEWCWQPVPYSSVYACRDDGVFLTLCYKREHQVVAWARHNTDGFVESTWMVPEDGIHAVYMIVRRTVGGVTRRFIERLADEPYDDWREHVGLDCSLTYDGRGQQNPLTLVAIAGQPGRYTCTATLPAFAASNVGDAIVVGWDEAADRVEFDGTVIEAVAPVRLAIVAYASATSVTVEATRTPEALSIGLWGMAVDTFSGLGHLEGRTVRVASDGDVAGDFVVTGGKVTIPRAGVLVHIGLPFDADFESLDLMLLGQESVSTRSKIIKDVGLLLQGTRQIGVGPSFDALTPHEERGAGRPLGVTPKLIDGWKRVDVTGSWGEAPRVCVRCSNPYGATLLAVETGMELGR